MTHVLLGIPTHKRPKLLRECLESIEEQQGNLPEIRVFVADNDQTGRAGSQVVAELRPTFRFALTSSLIDEPGISAVRNAILMEAQKQNVDFVAMIDDDVRASPRWIVTLIEAMQKQNSDVAAGPVLYEFESAPPKSVQLAFSLANQPSGAVDLILGTTGVIIACGALERANWPMFDPSYGLTGGGDKEWFTRLKKQGARFVWATDAPVFEFVPQTRSTRMWILKRNFRYGIDQIRITRAHGTFSELTGLIAKSGGSILLSPVLAFGLLTKNRDRILCQWARAIGRLAGLIGVRVHEYASRHA